MKDTLIGRFKAAELPQSEWNHRAHLVVAIHYLQEYPPQEALERLRTDIQNLNLYHDVYTTPRRGYHETRTRVWLAVLLSELKKGGDPADIVEKYAQTDVVRDYYAPERLDSLEARLDWLPPDNGILPLDPGGWCPATPKIFTFRAREGNSCYND